MEGEVFQFNIILVPNKGSVFKVGVRVRYRVNQEMEGVLLKDTPAGWMHVV